MNFKCIRDDWMISRIMSKSINCKKDKSEYETPSRKEALN